MNLQHLHWQACPGCMSRIVTERQRSQHTNGEWFESQEFECGCVVEYVPNFHREEVKTPCPESPKQQEKRAKQAEALRKVRQYVRRLDVDDEYKDMLTRYWPGGSVVSEFDV